MTDTMVIDTVKTTINGVTYTAAKSTTTFTFTFPYGTDVSKIVPEFTGHNATTTTTKAVAPFTMKVSSAAVTSLDLTAIRSVEVTDSTTGTALVANITVAKAVFTDGAIIEEFTYPGWFMARKLKGQMTDTSNVYKFPMQVEAILEFQLPGVGYGSYTFDNSKQELRVYSSGTTAKNGKIDYTAIVLIK